MRSSFDHAYTHMLLICIMSYEMRELPSWIFLMAITICVLLALLIAVVREVVAERSKAPCS